MISRKRLNRPKLFVDKPYWDCIDFTALFQSSPMDTPNLAAASMLVGKCLDDHHPERSGVSLIAFPGEESDSIQEAWLESLSGVRVRRSDRVLLAQPLHWPVPIIFGVLGASGADSSADSSVSGFEVRDNNVIVLKGDSPIQVVAHDGRKLVEIGKSLNGPTIRICQRDAAIQLPGKLSIAAAELLLRSHGGDVRIEADQEVVVQGDLIRLN